MDANETFQVTTLEDRVTRNHYWDQANRLYTYAAQGAGQAAGWVRENRQYVINAATLTSPLLQGIGTASGHSMVSAVGVGLGGFAGAAEVSQQVYNYASGQPTNVAAAAGGVLNAAGGGLWANQGAGADPRYGAGASVQGVGQFVQLTSAMASMRQTARPRDEEMGPESSASSSSSSQREPSVSPRSSAAYSYSGSSGRQSQGSGGESRRSSGSSGSGESFYSTRTHRSGRSGRSGSSGGGASR